MKILYKILFQAIFDFPHSHQIILCYSITDHGKRLAKLATIFGFSTTFIVGKLLGHSYDMSKKSYDTKFSKTNNNTHWLTVKNDVNMNAACILIIEDQQI